MQSAERFLLGLGRYTSDINFDGQLYLHAVRSPHPAASITTIETQAACDFPGVVMVLTGADYLSDGWSAPRVDFDAQLKGQLKPIGEFRFVPNHFMPHDRVRYQGEIVAVVLAETEWAAESGAVLVEVDYESLPNCVSLSQSTEEGVPAVWDLAPDNVAANAEYGDANLVQAQFDNATHVVTGEFTLSRLVANPMEPRAAIGEYRNNRYILHTNTQMPNEAQRMLAEDVIGVPLDRIRVVSPDMGGGFGSRAPLYAEMAIVLWAAQRCDRPVKWTSQRSESFLSDVHGRDWHSSAELALDADGRFLAYRVATRANIGAYPGQKGPMVSFVFGPSVISSVYRLPLLHLEIKAIYTNTVPIFPYRGAGAPETIHVLERMLDKAARLIGIDRAEIRLRNLISQTEMPYRSPVGVTYDSGDYETVMRKAMSLSDWSGFEPRRQAARANGKLRGIGLANFMKSAGGQPVEWGALKVEPDGSVEVRTGTRGHGQSHDVVIPLLVAQTLGVASEDVRLIEGDTDLIKNGRGTHGSRSMMMVSNVVARNGETIINLALKVGARLLESIMDDVRFEAGVVSTRLTNRSVSLAEIAQALAAGPIEGVETLQAELTFTNKQASYPSGTHVTEVEVDELTGEVSILAYHAVEDVGNVLAPEIAISQAHGGIAQGIGQALSEHCIYDHDSGQLLTGSFLDYAMPYASDLPKFSVQFHEVPSPTNPAGVKGLGENGPIGALPALINALSDALSPLGITDVPMPATAACLWKLIRQAKQKS